MLHKPLHQLLVRRCVEPVSAQIYKQIKPCAGIDMQTTEPNGFANLSLPGRNSGKVCQNSQHGHERISAVLSLILVSQRIQRGDQGLHLPGG